MTTTFCTQRLNRLRQKFSKPAIYLPNGIRINADVFWKVIYPFGLMTPEEFFELEIL